MVHAKAMTNVLLIARGETDDAGALCYDDACNTLLWSDLPVASSQHVVLHKLKALSQALSTIVASINMH